MSVSVCFLYSNRQIIQPPVVAFSQTLAKKMYIRCSVMD